MQYEIFQTEQKKLEAKLNDLKRKEGVIFNTGVDFLVLRSVMEEANKENGSDLNSIHFGIQIVLLNVMFLMGVQSNMHQRYVEWDKNFIAFIQKRKRILQHESSENEANNINKFAGMRAETDEMETNFVRTLTAQRILIPKLKLLGCSASTRKFALDQNDALSSRISQHAVRRGSRLEKIFHRHHDESPSDVELTPPEWEDLPRDFTTTLKSDTDDLPLSPRIAFARERSLSTSSIDTLSTAGEELINSIHNCFHTGFSNYLEESLADVVDFDDIKVCLQVDSSNKSFAE
jgi:hypothetical protein